MTNTILTDSNNIGLAQLRAAFPTLTGAGVTVGQAEAEEATLAFEVNPATVGEDNPTNSNDFITYWQGTAPSSTYNDGITGYYSAHATNVASYYYGPNGVAPGVAHVDNYDAATSPGNFVSADAVINMSFAYSDHTEDAAYDAYALANNTVLVAAAGNSGAPVSPGTAYNVISVGSSTAALATGPAYDGAAKPDISAPGSESSWTAPQVAGAAALLEQAATDAFTGQERTDALDFRTIKALLLNGATKPSDYFTGPYAPTATDPLNARYGSGVLNVYNSVNALYAGEQAADAVNEVAAGQDGFFPVTGAAVPTEGWDYSPLAAAANHDAIAGYKLNLTAGDTFTATLTWAADAGNAIDHFSLELYDNTAGTFVAASTAADSNVQQIVATLGTTDTYDLQVVLSGGATLISDPYALAWAEATPECFCAGTRIQTLRGDIAVESLCVGDIVLTYDNRVLPVRWLGVRTVATRFTDPLALPIRIRAGALGKFLPHTDLLLSPGHAVLLDGMLVQAGALVRLSGISRVLTMPEQFGYYHVELDTHALLLAEGVAAESYLATAEPTRFDNPGSGRAPPPELPYPRVKSSRQLALGLRARDRNAA
jgi:hypothetical protein